MGAILGWLLAVASIGLGGALYGWPGVAFAGTVTVFWLLLQFSRAMRALKVAGQNPVGRIDSAVMLHAKLRRGMRLLEILPLTRSLGVKVAEVPETFEWKDEAGDRVRIELVDGRCARWQLERRVDQA